MSSEHDDVLNTSQSTSVSEPVSSSSFTPTTIASTSSSDTLIRIPTPTQTQTPTPTPTRPSDPMCAVPCVKESIKISMGSVSKDKGDSNATSPQAIKPVGLSIKSSVLSKPKFDIKQSMRSEEKSGSAPVVDANRQLRLTSNANVKSSALAESNSRANIKDHPPTSLFLTPSDANQRKSDSITATANVQSTNTLISGNIISSEVQRAAPLGGFLPLGNGEKDFSQGKSVIKPGQLSLFSTSRQHPISMISTSSNCDITSGGSVTTGSHPSTSSTVTATDAALSTQDFVFGENLGDRAENFSFSFIGDQAKETLSETLDTKSQEEKNIFQTSVQSKTISRPNIIDSPSLSSVSSFQSQSSIISSTLTSISEISNQSTNGKAMASKSLNESAAEYCQNQAAIKRKFDEVTPVTGEEEEVNVNQLQAKLYVFEKNSGSWMEKGRGIIRLNDVKDKSQSRLVMRTSGSLRVILNTQVYPEMSVERPSEKSVRFTGLHEGNARIYLISGTPRDIQSFFDALILRKTRGGITKDNPANEDPTEKKKKKLK